MKYVNLYESFKIKKSLQDFLDDSEIDLKDTVLSCFSSELTSLRGVEKFTNLKELYCWNNYLKSLEGIENLKNLILLSCYDNDLTSLKGIENLTNLQTLYCSHNNLTNLKEIVKLKNLKNLDCSNNKLKNLDEIKNLNLDYLECDKNPWECPFTLEFQKKYDIEYSKENMNYFKTYESQKIFIEKYPDKIGELEIFGIDDKLRDEATYKKFGVSDPNLKLNKNLNG